MTNEILMNPNKIIEGLKEVGYRANMEMAIAIRNAYILKKPLYIEGPSGVGKTKLSKAIQEMMGWKWFRVQCTPEITEKKALYTLNYHRQIIEMQSVKSDILEEEKEKFINSLFTREYIAARPLLKSLMEKEPSVLLVDEIDKAPEEFEYSLLEIFGEKTVTISEINETIVAENIPFTVITSNNVRPISDTILRRCIYLHIDYPTVEEEVEIIQTVAKVEESLAAGIAETMKIIREEKLRLSQRPSTSEAVEWAEILSLHLEIEEEKENTMWDNATGDSPLKRSMIANVGVIAKSKKDTEAITKQIESMTI